MDTFFTIAEYNPLHNGHQYHIRQMRKAGAEGICAVMSGNYTQRGEASVFDKHLRARAAVQCGADLVVELPLPWSVAPAERFAFGGVFLACRSGVMDAFSFGCETPSLDLLNRTADSLINVYKSGDTARKNSSFPALIQTGLPEENKQILSEPNNVLAVEYLRHLHLAGFTGSVFPVGRQGTAHDSDTVSGMFASASCLRGRIRSGEEVSRWIPEECRADFAEAVHSGFFTGSPKEYERQLLSILRGFDRRYFCSLPFAGGGLGDRMAKSVRTACSYEELCSAVKTKRFTHAGIRRMILHAVLGVSEEILMRSPPYIRVLAFNQTGRELLGQMKKKSDLPVVAAKSDIDRLDLFSKKVYALECRATDLYNTFLRSPRPCGTEMTDPIFRTGV